MISITECLSFIISKLHNGLDITNGGTGSKTVTGARQNIFENKPLSISEGGIGANTADVALASFGGISVTKLWENASPTGTFAAQTISLSLNVKEIIRIEWKPSTTGGERFFLDGVVGNDMLCNFIAFGNSNNIPNIRTRNVELRTTGIKFYDAYSKSISASTTSASNTQIIPVAIYRLNNYEGVN